MAFGGSSFFLPPQASTFASEVHDDLFNFILFLNVFFLALIFGIIVYMAVRYRRRGDGDRTSANEGNTKLEIIWAVIPSLIMIGLFFWGLKGFMNEAIPPSDSVLINVRAQKWVWSFQYPDDGIVSDELIVPVNKPVQLTMTSADVLHSFYVAAFRIKKDVLPNRYTVIWFNATEIGEYWIQCAEYCGKDHSRMRAKVKVVSQEEYQSWLDSGGGLGGEGVPLPVLGERLTAKFGCVACHSKDGSRLIGPSFKGIYGHQVELEGGESCLVDDNYIRESLMDPQAKLVKGFGPLMPTFKGLLRDQHVEAIIAYIRSLGPEEGHEGEEVEQEEGAETAPKLQGEAPKGEAPGQAGSSDEPTAPPSGKINRTGSTPEAKE